MGTESNSAALPSSPISKWVKQYRIDPSDIRTINIEGQFIVLGNVQYDQAISKSYIDLNNYFANLSNLHTIDLGSYANIYNGWHNSYGPLLISTRALFANDPKLNSVIGFFGNEQALKNVPAAGDQSTGLINKNDGSGSTFSTNIMNNNISTAHMFDGDSSLFTGNNAQANVDAISSIPMNNVRDASYMFNNTKLSDSNITTDWDLSNLRNADHMFAGCNLSNLNGFNKLGNWISTSKLKPYTKHWQYNNMNYWYPSNKKGEQDNSFNKVITTQLQNASYMFANNPHLTDISGISGNNISINPITNVSDMFNGDTDLKDVSYIEDGNNKWEFTQKPNVTGMFDKTGVGYNTPEISRLTNNGKYILKPAPETDTVYFDGDSNNNTNQIAKQGTRGANESVTAPIGYHFTDNKSSESFTFDGSKHTFSVTPNQYKETINYQVQNNNEYAKHGQILNHFTKKLNDNRTDTNNVQFAVNNNDDTNIPTGYHLVNSSTIVGNHQNDSTDTVLIAPNPASFTVNFIYNTRKVGKKIYNGLVDNNITVNGKTVDANGDVPYNYTISNGQPTNFTYNANSSKNIANIKVSPQSTPETINYIYNNGKRSFNEGSNTFNGIYNTTDNLNNGNTSAQATGLKAGWQISGNQSWTYNNKSKNINVKPINVSVTVKYVDNKSNVLGSYKFDGNDSRATDAGDNNVDVDNSNEPGIPSGYHLSNKYNAVNFDKNVQYVSVSPNTYTETVNYVVDNNSQYAKKNENLGSYTKVLNDENDTKAGNTSLNINNNNTPNIPIGYQLVNRDNVVIKHQADKNYTDKILIKPEYVTNYVLFNDDSASTEIPIKGYYDSNAIVNNPSDYHYTGTKQITLGVNGSIKSLNVSKNIIYIDFNGDSSANISREAGDSTVVSAPSDYHFTDDKTTEPVSFSQNGKTYTFNVTKNTSKTDTDHIDFNGDSAADKTVQGTDGTEGSVSAPNGYHYVNGSNGQFTYNGGTHSFDVAKDTSVSPVSSNTPSSEPSNGGSVTPDVPFIPFNLFVPTLTSGLPSILPNNIISSRANSLAVTPAPSHNNAQSVHITNKDYPIQYNYHKSNYDVVTYHGKKYDVHYHNNGKNTINIRVPAMIHDRHHYRYHNIVVSLDLPTPHIDEQTTRIIDQVNFNQSGKQIFTKHGLVKAIDNAKIGKILNYHGQKFAAIKVPNHFRFFMIRKNCQAIALSYHSRKWILKPNQLWTIYINRIFVLHGHYANYLRYQIRYHNHNYWITGRDDYTPNSYLQISDFKAQKAHYVQVINHCGLYTSHIYNSKTHIRSLKRGTVVHVKKIINLGPKRNFQTRLILTNGDFVTANKNYVKIIKFKS